MSVAPSTAPSTVFTLPDVLSRAGVSPGAGGSASTAGSSAVNLRDDSPNKYLAQVERGKGVLAIRVKAGESVTLRGPRKGFFQNKNIITLGGGTGGSVFYARISNKGDIELVKEKDSTAQDLISNDSVQNGPILGHSKGAVISEKRGWLKGNKRVDLANAGNILDENHDHGKKLESRIPDDLWKPISSKNGGWRRTPLDNIGEISVSHKNRETVDKLIAKAKRTLGEATVLKDQAEAALKAAKTERNNAQTAVDTAAAKVVVEQTSLNTIESEIQDLEAQLNPGNPFKSSVLDAKIHERSEIVKRLKSTTEASNVAQTNLLGKQAKFDAAEARVYSIKNDVFNPAEEAVKLAEEVDDVLGGNKEIRDAAYATAKKAVETASSTT